MALATDRLGVDYRNYRGAPNTMFVVGGREDLDWHLRHHVDVATNKVGSGEVDDSRLHDIAAVEGSLATLEALSTSEHQSLPDPEDQAFG